MRKPRKGTIASGVAPSGQKTLWPSGVVTCWRKRWHAAQTVLEICLPRSTEAVRPRNPIAQSLEGYRTLRINDSGCHLLDTGAV